MDIIREADARVDTHMRPHSVIMIGLPTSPGEHSAQLSDVTPEESTERTKNES